MWKHRKEYEDVILEMREEVGQDLLDIGHADDVVTVGLETLLDDTGRVKEATMLVGLKAPYGELRYHWTRHAGVCKLVEAEV